MGDFPQSQVDDISSENAHQIFGFFLVRYIQAAERKPALRNANGRSNDPGKLLSGYLGIAPLHPAIDRRCKALGSRAWASQLKSDVVCKPNARVIIIQNFGPIPTFMNLNYGTAWLLGLPSWR